ncbi:expressed unknown protein [Seminavis robusta]|uniref:Uncharacterized protein n=1 Tax=Seminavis robusta TaxID=568900 RepID=A0A9N8DM50_9STRA|nr:expressed unknown protein [Seminavis robusta]|eukprot:Sro208_g087180.1 n/a (160) ;mRNA; f:78876-79355
MVKFASSGHEGFCNSSVHFQNSKHWIYNAAPTLEALIWARRLQLRILSKGRLKQLTLYYYSDSPIEWDHVISALKQNTSLESLDYENGDDNDYTKHRQIRYYTTLNRHGRSKLRALGAKKEVLVSCLCSVHGDKYDDFTEHDVHYGLLRQAPSLWADAL